MLKQRLKRFFMSFLAFTMMFTSIQFGQQVSARDDELKPKKQISYEEIVRTSNLPVININTEGGQGPNRSEKKDVNADFSIVNSKKGEDFTVLQGEDGSWPMTIKGRGNSSWTMPTGKKPYNIKFVDKQDIFGYGKAKKWCLISSWVDTSFIRNYLAYKLARQLDPMSPDCELVELCIDGVYEGIYLLCENKEIKDYRVEPVKDGSDMTGDGNVTEFLLETDSRAYQNNEPNKFTTPQGVYIVTAEPDEKEITSATDPRFLYIQEHMAKVEEAVMTHTDYEKYIDVESLIDLYLVNEFSKNPDFGFGYQPCYSSTYMYLSEGGKVYFGPAWDFDISFGRNDYVNNADEQNRDTHSPEGLLTAETKWIKELFEDPIFVQKVKERWAEIQPIISDLINKLAPEAIGLVSKTQAYDFEIWQAPEIRRTNYDCRQPLPFAQEAAFVVQFMTDRQTWLNKFWSLDEKIYSYDTYTAKSEVDLDSVNDVNALLNSSSMLYADESLVNGTAPSNVLGLFNQMSSETVEGTSKKSGMVDLEKEVSGTEYVTYGDKPGEIGNVTLNNPITITGPAGNVCDWVKSTGSGGFGNINTKITITESGRYVYLVNNENSWVNNGTRYTMGGNGYGGTKMNQIYIIDVAPNGSITMNDGSILVQATGYDIKVMDTHYGHIAGSNYNFTLSYKEDQSGNAGITIPGTGESVFNVRLSEEFNGTLEKVNRPAESVYTDPLKVESTYVYVEGEKAASWSVINAETGIEDNGEIVIFDESTKKVTANGNGKVIITATSLSGASASVEITSHVTTASKVEIVDDATKGLYFNGVSGDKLEKGNWSTFAPNSATRYTSFFEVSSEQLDSALNFVMSTRQSDEIFGGEATYYVLVNGKPFFKAGNDSLELNGFASVEFAKDEKYGSYSRYSYMKHMLANLTEVNKGLKDLLKVGANQVDIFVISEDGGAMVKPYFFSTNSVDVEIPDHVTEVKVIPNDVTLEVGESTTLSAVIYPSSLGNKEVRWTTSNKNVVTVDGGKLTAIKAGTATITATVDGVSATAKVTVKEKEIKVESIELSNIPTKLSVGQTVSVKATVKPTDATNTALVWLSNNENVATVKNGQITGVKPGTVTITVSSVSNPAITKSFEVTVEEKIIDVKTISVSNSSLSMMEGEQFTVTATVYPTDASNKSLTWTSENENVVTVKDGVITAVGVGNAKVIVRSVSNPNVTQVITVNVSEKQTIHVSDIVLSINNITLLEGKSTTITATVEPSNADNKTLIWTSSDTNVATVNIYGQIKAIKEGTATIIVTSIDNPNITRKVTVIVEKQKDIPVTQIVLSETDITIKEMNAFTLRATIFPENTTNRNVMWSSSNTNVATVKNGVIYGIKAGSTIITARVGDVQATCQVTVKENTINIMGILVNPTLLELTVGDTSLLNATIIPSNATNRNIIWSSKNDTVAKVDALGNVTAVGAGETEIIVTSAYDETKFNVVKVTVKDKEPGSEFYAPIYDCLTPAYAAGSVVYNVADQKYYVYTNAWGLPWTNRGQLDSQWTVVTSDLGNIRTIQGISTADIGEIVKIGNYYYTPLYNDAYTHWTFIGGNNAYWNCITSVVADRWQ